MPSKTQANNQPAMGHTCVARGVPKDPVRLTLVGFDSVQLNNTASTIIFNLKVPTFTHYSLDLTHFKTIRELI
jgi:hypothetical protein